MPHNFIIAFPEDGTRKRDAAKGVFHFDFWEGVVTAPDGTKTTLSTNLKNSQHDFIRSVTIFLLSSSKVASRRIKPR